MVDDLRPEFARIVDDAMTARRLSARQVAALSRDVDPAGRGVNNKLVSNVQNGRWGPRGPTRRTVTLLVDTLSLDQGAVDRALASMPRIPRVLPEDFEHLTDLQWANVCETARLYRMANESGPGAWHGDDSGFGPGVAAADG